MPPPEPSVRLINEPVQTAVGPPIANGSAFTVIVFVAMQPVPSVYVTMVVPLDTPVRVPVVELVFAIVATLVLLLVQLPPALVFDNIIVAA